MGSDGEGFSWGVFARPLMYSCMEGRKAAESWMGMIGMGMGRESKRLDG